MKLLFRSYQKLRHYHSALGFTGVLRFLWAKLTGKSGVTATRIDGVRNPVYVRIGTTDVSVLRQIFIERQYDVPLRCEPKVIIDAGANIGLASVFFANKYPHARIFAIEPEDSNFSVLKKNVAAYPQIKALKAALWSKDGRISLTDPGQGHHGFQTTALNSGVPSPSVADVEALTVDSLLRRESIDKLDLLKIDIEGAEKVVFETPGTWLRGISVIMAELHDHLQPGCTKVFLDATSEFETQTVKGETIVRARSLSLA